MRKSKNEQPSSHEIQRLVRTKTVRRAPPGAPPGTLLAAAGARPSKVSMFRFSAECFDEKPTPTMDDIAKAMGTKDTVWINVDGLGSVDVLSDIGHALGIHPLVLEDVINGQQRAKVEVYDGFLFVVVQMCEKDASGQIVVDHLSLVLGDHWLVSFQENDGDCFDPVRERLRKGKGKVRTSGADYIGYALLDSVVDNYFPMLEAYGERLELLEERAIFKPQPRLIGELHAVKRDFLQIRRAVWPQREVLSSLYRDEYKWIDKETRLYLRDCYTHIVEIMDLVESYREIATGLMEVYLSAVSNRMNEIMKVLTLFSTLFMPLTFIAGVYGMNFHGDSPWSMPELGWYWGYPLCILAMVLTAGGLFVYFRRKGWIGAG